MKMTLDEPKPKTAQGRYERLEARVSPDLKRLFQQAADMRGVTLSDFLINSAHDVAVQTVEQHKVIRLGLEDSRVFAEALLSPPAPKERLRAAARHYLRRLKSRSAT